MVVYNGDTNNLTGVGSPNPVKLTLPMLDQVGDAPTQTALLRIQQFLNNLVAPSGSTDFEISQTYSVQGTISPAVGATGYLPPFFASVLAGTTVSLVGVKYVLRGGTCDIDIYQNGSDIVPGISVSTSPGSSGFGSGYALADGDLLAPVVMSASGADGLSFTFVLRVT
jgi:hypothetical protein